MRKQEEMQDAILQRKVSAQRLAIIQKIHPAERKYTLTIGQIDHDRLSASRSKLRKSAADQVADTEVNGFHELCLRARAAGSTSSRETDAYVQANNAKIVLSEQHYAALMEACCNHMPADIELAMFSQQILNERSGSQPINAYPNAIDDAVLLADEGLMARKAGLGRKPGKPLKCSELEEHEKGVFSWAAWFLSMGGYSPIDQGGAKQRDVVGLSALHHALNLSDVARRAGLAAKELIRHTPADMINGATYVCQSGPSGRTCLNLACDGK